MTESLFWIVARGFRPEIEVIFLLSLCFYLIDLLESRDRLLYWFALGLVWGIGFWTHPNMLFLFLGFLIYLFIRNGLMLLRKKGLYIMLLGAGLSFLPYAIFVLHSGIYHFKAQTVHRASVLWSIDALMSSIRSEPRRYLTIIQFPKRFFVVLIEVISLIYLFRLKEGRGFPVNGHSQHALYNPSSNCD